MPDPSHVRPTNNIAGRASSRTLPGTMRPITRSPTAIKSNTNHFHRCSLAGACNGLIRTFASSISTKAAPGQGFTWERHSRDTDNEIHIQAAEDDDPRANRFILHLNALSISCSFATRRRQSSSTSNSALRNDATRSFASHGPTICAPTHMTLTSSCSTHWCAECAS